MIDGAETKVSDLQGTEDAVIGGTDQNVVVSNVGGNLTLTNEDTGFTAVVGAGTNANLINATNAVQNSDADAAGAAGATVGDAADVTASETLLGGANVTNTNVAGEDTGSESLLAGDPVTTYNNLYDTRKSSGAVPDMAIDRYKRDGTVLDGYQDLISAYTAAYPDGDATASEILLDGTDTTQTGGTDTTQTGGTDTTTGALTNLDTTTGGTTTGGTDTTTGGTDTTTGGTDTTLTGGTDTTIGTDTTLTGGTDTTIGTDTTLTGGTNTTITATNDATVTTSTDGVVTVTTVTDANGNATVTTDNSVTGDTTTDNVLVDNTTTVTNGAVTIDVNAEKDGTKTTVTEAEVDPTVDGIVDVGTVADAVVDAATITTVEEPETLLPDTEELPLVTADPIETVDTLDPLDTVEDEEELLEELEPVVDTEPDYVSGIAGIGGRMRPVVAPYYQPLQTGLYSFYRPQAGVDQTPTAPVFNQPTSYLSPTGGLRYGNPYIGTNLDLARLRELAELQGTGAERLPSENLMDDL